MEENEIKTDSDGWIRWGGGECPVESDTEVEVQLSRGDNFTGIANTFFWELGVCFADIIAYRVVSEQTEASNKRTAEEIAPKLWNAYKDVLNEEALIALRQVIEDEEQHEGISFDDQPFISACFVWKDTDKGHDFWKNVKDGKYNKKQESHSEHLYTDSRLQESVKQLKDVKDTGSAATSKHYNEKLIQPIEIAQMVLTKEEFIGAMKFNIMKYSQRAGSKEGESSVKDWNKSLQYKYWLELALEGHKIDPRKDVV